LDIQEFLQSYVRAEFWRFSEQRFVADGWIFARCLDKDELLQFAKEGHLSGRVIWTEGKALVLVTTRELVDIFVRIEVSARLQGYGQNVDRFAPARDSWDLDSNGLLEKKLVAALEAHFKSVRSPSSTSPQRLSGMTIAVRILSSRVASFAPCALASSAKCPSVICLGPFTQPGS
jgi:hypothetical protein